MNFNNELYKKTITFHNLKSHKKLVFHLPSEKTFLKRP